MSLDKKQSHITLLRNAALASAGQKPDGLIAKIKGFQRALTVSEVAELLASSTTTIYRMIELQEVPYFRVRGSIRFDPSALIAWLEKQGVR